MTPLTELQIVTKFRARARIACPALAIVGIPNAAKRGQWAVNQAKREGMSAGFPDMICLWEGGVAFIEWKRVGGRLSLNQVEWLARLADMGHRAIVCDDADKGLAFLRSCGAPFLVPAKRAA